MNQFDEENKTDNIEKTDDLLFQLTDEELYDDVKPKETKKFSAKKATRNIIVLIVIAGLAILAAGGALIWGITQQNQAKEYSDKYTDVLNTLTAKEKEIEVLNSKVVELSEKIKTLENGSGTVDPDKKYPKGATLTITEIGGDGGLGVRVKADVNSDVVIKDDALYVLYWGDTIKLLEDATINKETNTYWGRIDGGYVRLEVDGEVWAE